MTSLIEILEEHEINFKQAGEHSHVRQGWIGIDCDRCGEGTQKFHLGINIENGYATCWRCGYRDLSEVLTQITGQRINRETIDGLRRGRPSTRLPEIRPVRLPAGRLPLSPVHRRYLEGRGLDASLVASRWGLEGLSIHAVLGWRIFIPVHLHGKIVTWTTRAIGAQPLRYKSASPNKDGGMPIKDLLYGEDFVRHAVVVVEGPADVWRIGPGAVATFGIAYSQEQVERLSKFPIRAVCFDAEPRAQRAAGKLCEALHCFPGETYQIELEHGDPGEATDEQIDFIRKTFLD